MEKAEDGKQEGEAGGSCCSGRRCGGCCCKAVAALVLLLIGGTVGYLFGHCHSRMCPAPAAVGAPAQNK